MNYHRQWQNCYIILLQGRRFFPHYFPVLTMGPCLTAFKMEQMFPRNGAYGLGRELVYL